MYINRGRFLTFFFCLGALLGGIPQANSQPLKPQSASSDTSANGAQEAMVRDPQTRKVVQLIENKLASYKGYSAQVETSGLDPNGGFNTYREEIAFQRLDKMRVERTVLSAHNADAKGSVITTVINGTWSYSKIERPAPDPEEQKMREKIMRQALEQPDAQNMTPEEKENFMKTMMPTTAKPSFSKVNLVAIAKAGGSSVREYLSSMNNLLDPFGQYKRATLKLERETPEEWVVSAEYNMKNVYWPSNRLIFDKKTGFLKKVETDIKELGRTVTLLNVKTVSPQERLEDSLFRMEIPPSAHVLDQTDSYLDIETQGE